MRRTRSLAATVAVAAATAVLVGAGCGGDSSNAQTDPTTAPAEGLLVTVIDGDTREPLAGAQVVGFDETGTPIGSAVTADAEGHATIPSGTAVAYATFGTHTPDSRTILRERTTVTLPLYDPALQSPQYGGGPRRTRYVPGADPPPPSGEPAWTYRGKALLEFPPSIASGNVVLATNRGRIITFNARTGGIRWQKRHTTSSYIASSPAIIAADRRVLVAGMDGRLVAYEIVSGRVAWEFSSGDSPIESSPLVIGETAIVGAWNGRLYAVSTKTGRLRWSFEADGQIKGSAAQAGENVIVGDYAGNVYAIRTADGALVWKTKAGKRFYGGPGISGGTAVIGDVGGAVVALDVATGRRRWRHGTGGAFVYGSPAIANGTVFIGSYNGRFEALGLANGKLRWSFDAGGRISGSATVVDGVVYTAVLARPGEPDRSYGLDVRTGEEVWRGDDGRYSPAVAAGRTLYIVGRTTLYAYPAP